MTPFLSQRKNENLIPILALAILKNPNSSLVELAKIVGIGRTTLYRFCKTREELLERLFDYGIKKIYEILETSELATASPLKALNNMAHITLQNKEITVFMARNWRPLYAGPSPEKLDWNAKLDAFFLRGQKEGIFRIDLPASALSEMWVSLVIGLVDAEWHGRIAKAELANLLLCSFLQGGQAR